jgi:hypothetical protein
LSAIDDLADLFLTVSEAVKRADFANLFPRFVALTEDQISKALRLEDFSATVTLTADINGLVALPANFREVREVRLASTKRVLTGGSMAVLDDTFQDVGVPAAYALGGGGLNLRPRQATDIELTYWGGMPRLTAIAPTNAMLTRYSDCYLHGVAYEVLKWVPDLDAAASVKALFDASLYEAISDNERRLFSTVKYRYGGTVP